jgi:hypothetical protein
MGPCLYLDPQNYYHETTVAFKGQNSLLLLKAMMDKMRKDILGRTVLTVWNHSVIAIQVIYV